VKLNVSVPPGFTTAGFIVEMLDDGVEEALGEMVMESPSASFAVTSNCT